MLHLYTLLLIHVFILDMIHKQLTRKSLNWQLKCTSRSKANVLCNHKLLIATPSLQVTVHVYIDHYNLFENNHISSVTTGFYIQTKLRRPIGIRCDEKIQLLNMYFFRT